ncbi:MAG: ATP-dependent transcriptional regulator [Actinomycetia bacterium]|nr:ATP-dependent transcriptional regulator [Actinomycetes bacterium]
MERAGLVQHLAGCTTKLVLVEAPAGYGKSSLVAQWRASPAEGRQFAWVSADSRDNNVVRFWWHLVAALQRACPELEARDLLSHLRPQPAGLPESLLAALVNELAALSAPVVVALDDYQLISNLECHEQMAFLLTHLPPTAQIVLITRVDPPLPIGRLRTTGDLVEIKMAELRFTATEAGELVRAVSDVQLNEADLGVLLERTEGWPAGVYLAALTLRGQSSPSQFVQQFSGDNRFIVEFLVEEVLSNQPRQIMEFLRRTAILDRFTPSLCDAVLGSADAAGIIDVLERENLFLIALDDDRQWYRYHRLFGQMLRSLLMETEPADVPALHARASRWHRQRGSAGEAITHALAAGDTAGAIAVLADSWPGRMAKGRIDEFQAWLNSIGDDRILASPVAAHCAAWCAALSGDRESFTRWLAVIETAGHDGPLPDGMQSLKSSAALLHGVFGFDGIRDMLQSATVSVDLETDPASPWYALARTALGAALYLSGEFDTAVVPLRDAVLHSNASSTLIRMLACSVSAVLATERGQLDHAQELAAAAREIVVSNDLGETPHGAPAYTACGAVSVMRGRLGAARDEFEHALRLRRPWFGISPWVTVDTMLRLTPVLYQLGDPAAAASLLGEAADVLAASPDGAEAQLFRVRRLEEHLSIRSRSLAEPLTDREEEVLRLLRGSLSLREIGEELSLSANTIKTHVRAIYRKLDVGSRQEAVERGHATGILLPAGLAAGQMSCSWRARRTASPR